MRTAATAMHHMKRGSAQLSLYIPGSKTEVAGIADDACWWQWMLVAGKQTQRAA